jgi:signal transduction histidine kinase/CheY-like chemotaxis protein
MEYVEQKQDIVVDDVLADLRAELGTHTDSASLRRALTRVLAETEPPPNHLFSCFSSNDFSLFHRMIENLPMAVSWFDQDLNLLICNQIYKDLFDFPEEMFSCGRLNLERLFRFNAERGEYGPGDPAQMTQLMLLRAKENQAQLIQHVRPNGTVLEIRSAPMPGGGFLTLYTDITEHKHAEQAAVRNATYLRAVIAQLPQALTVIDENLNIVLWNHLWEEYCGARPGFLYDGVTFEEAVRHLAENGEYGGGDAAEIDAQVSLRVDLAKQFTPHCFRRQRPNGKVIEIEGRTMDIEGKVVGFITMYSDITDRLAMDDLKQAKEAAEAASRLKSEFLALMSHEIRTPLAGVIGMLKLAMRDTKISDDTRQLIVRGEDNAHSLLAIINDLLDFSKIEAGKLTLENIDFGLGATVQDVMLMFNTQAMDKGLDFFAQQDADVPLYVVGDPVRLRQVLVNLIGNAFKFTERGTISVQVSLVSRLHDTSRVRFSVKDSGIGIPADAIGRIFAKFEQADNTTTRRFGGTGLGLTICRQLVQLMGGEIGVNSELGRGSEFYFELPLADGIEIKKENKYDILLPHTHQLSVLCVDDFVTNRIIARMLVEEMGHEVDVVDSGEAALAAVAKHPYDVILMDGRMPGMDGVTASGLIRAGGLPDAPVLDKDIFIIAVTANASEEDRKYYLQAGMDDFLSKPIDEAILHRQFCKVITRQLQRGIALPARVLHSGGELDAMFGVNLADTSADTSADTPVDALPKTIPSELAAEYANHLAEKDLLGKMGAMFVQDAQEKLAGLEQAVAARVASEAGRLLHSMRGSVGYLENTARLQELCLQLEPQADAGNWALIDEFMPEIRQLVANCRDKDNI